MFKGFWAQLAKPILGLAPMDGVTDAPFRFITAKYGKPSLVITEFTAVEGICAGAEKTLEAFLYSEEERPVIAQIFGTDPECFYKSTFVVCELGFDGVDINMGCPAKNVSHRGAGAGLIQTPELAKQIVRKTQQAVIDWSNGKTIEEAGLPTNIIAKVKSRAPQNIQRQLKPVSIKTRIGYNSVTIEEWVKHLLETEPANLTIHGRTLKQMYTGSANWEAIAAAAKIVKQTETGILGNGDIKSLEDAHAKITQYGVDGALIGRSAFGNPWLFKTNNPAEIKEKLLVAIEHSKTYENIFGPQYFVPMRKHLSWYCRGFSNASEIRQQLMNANSTEDVQKVLTNLI